MTVADGLPAASVYPSPCTPDRPRIICAGRSCRTVFHVQTDLASVRGVLSRSARLVPIAAGLSLLAACSSKPLVPYSTDTPPLVLAPAAQAGVVDKRARFREIYCAVLQARRGLPDYRDCEEALTRVGNEPAGTGRQVDLGPSSRRLLAAVVLGLGFDCIEKWLASTGSVAEHVRQYGYDQVMLKVDALSSTANNARQIRDALLAMPPEAGPARLVLIGYSKGAPDILDALVTYPEIRSRIAAVVSAAGAIGGSPLANDAEQYQADLLRHFPGATCESGDGGAVASLRPAARRAWLAANPLPTDVRYYSLVTFPQLERISSALKSSYRKLARIDARNDGQVIFYDQVIPGSDLMAYVNADHWALAVPIARSHATIGAVFVTRERVSPRSAPRGRAALHRGRSVEQRTARQSWPLPINQEPAMCSPRSETNAWAAQARARRLTSRGGADGDQTVAVRPWSRLRRRVRHSHGFIRSIATSLCSGSKASIRSESAIRSAVGRGTHRQRETPVRARRRCRAKRRARVHRLGGNVRDRRRPFVLEQADARHGDGLRNGSSRWQTSRRN